MPEKDRSWTTRSEINFIKGLGMWSSENHAVKDAGRAELLRRYLQSAKHRTNWGAVDKDQVIKFAEECLRQELNN